MEIIPKARNPLVLKKYAFLNKKKVFSEKALSVHFENVFLFYFITSIILKGSGRKMEIADQPLL